MRGCQHSADMGEVPFMVKEGIVLWNKVSQNEIVVDKAKFE